MSSEAKAVTQRVPLDAKSLSKVTVFEDRAELKREIAVNLVVGLNEIVIENVSQQMQDDSVRVTGRGDAIIEEVQVSHRRLTTGENDSERAKELREQKKQLEGELRDSESAKRSAEKRIDALDLMLTQIGKGIAEPKEGKFKADSETFTSIDDFFAYYDQQTAKLRASIFSTEEQRRELEEKIRSIDHELNRINNGQYAKVISVLLEAKTAAEVKLELSYQVWGASWFSFYDIRVDTKDDKTDMQLSYYANVTQSTGEQWENAQLVLSTARPCLGGTIPELGTLDATFYRPPPPPQPMMARGAPQMMMKMSARSVTNTLDEGVAAGAAFAPRLAGVNQQATSTEFTIVRPCSIPSDGAQHKVTIGIVTLSPQLVHETVPSKNASAFLTASSVNSSNFPLLAGQASVYLDGAFVAKTDIKAVSPGERFRTSLGVDPAVKIDYKPAHKYHEQIGMLTKTSSLIHEQKLSVKNTRADSILIVVREQVPRTTEEKIKVKLISPDAVEKVTEDAVNENENPTPGVKLLPNNNLQWTIKLEKGATQNLLVKYAIEHPPSERIEIVERFN